MDNSNDAGKIIGIVSNQIKRQFDESAYNKKLTGVQGKLLHFMLAHSDEQDFFQKDIEDVFNLRRSTATGILQLMEKNGWIRREAVSYDARLKKIIVSEKGSKMKDLVQDSIRVMEERIKKNISEEDLEVFFKVIQQMSKNLE